MSTVPNPPDLQAVVEELDALYACSTRGPWRRKEGQSDNIEIESPAAAPFVHPIAPGGTATILTVHDNDGNHQTVGGDPLGAGCNEDADTVVALHGRYPVLSALAREALAWRAWHDRGAWMDRFQDMRAGSLYSDVVIARTRTAAALTNQPTPAAAGEKA